MGCCVSTHKDKTSQSKHLEQHTFVSKSPPRGEEEAVKEVLSETFRPESPAREEIKSNLLLPTTPKKKGFPDLKVEEEISEDVSELSDTISTNTLKEDDNYQQHTQRVFTSQGYNGNYLHHHQLHYTSISKTNQGRSPARRRPEPSPPRRNSPSQGGPRREIGGVRSNVGRSPSARRNGPSPARVRMIHGPDEDHRRKMQLKEEDCRESQEWQGPKESLENPLVSLECFIFL